MSIIKDLDNEINLVNSSKPTKDSEEIKLNVSEKVKKVLKDLEDNHDNSWAIEMYLRNKNNLDNIAIFYRGNKITYREMFEQAFIYAKKLKTLGYGENSEVPVCMSNTPEFVYLFLAINLIGAKINSFGEWFDEQYNIELLNNTGAKHVFVTDDIYDDIKEKIEKSNIENIIMVSLEDSLPKDKDGNKYNPYKEIDDKFHSFENRIDKWKNISSKPIISMEEFKEQTPDFKGRVVANRSINDPCSITYTSGTTSPGKPKAVLQSNKSYMTLSRFKESDISGMPSMRNLTVLGHIPAYTHMELSCALSDTLYEKCTIALEPYYSKEFFPYSIAINKPNFVPASVGFWTYLCNLLNFDDSFKNMDLSYLMIPTITGEGASAGEEKYFNQTSKKHKFGSSKLPYPLAPVTFSIGGGTTESSGIFVTLFKGLQEKLLHNAIKKETLGLTPHRFVECEVLNDKGEYCKLNEPGLIVVSADSPCNMMEYYNDPEDTKKCYVVDATGKKWFSLGTYGYKSDKKGRIKMKGRLNDLIYMSDGNVVPYYVIEDSILKDTKNVMSCSLVKTENDYGEELYSCHVKFQPFTTTPKDKIINSIILRLQNDIPVEVLDKLIIVNDDEPFELAPSGKRFTKGLETRPISDKDIFVKNYLYQLPAKNKVYKKS